MSTSRQPYRYVAVVTLTVEGALGRVRTERGAQRLVTLLEPAMIVTFGLVVAIVALSVLQAIYGVNAGVYR